jgi:DNA-directed RNA polymerase specialized sigma24 family protein
MSMGLVTSACPVEGSTHRARVNGALRAAYPRLVAVAHRVIRVRRVEDLEAVDLCQEGVLRAVEFVYRFPDERFDALDGKALEAILYTVAEQAMRFRVIDHIRRADHRRRHRHLMEAGEDLDRSFEAGQDARATLHDMLARSNPPCRRVLQAAAEVGDVDIGSIIERTGFSRAYVYRLLQALIYTGSAE